MSYDKIIDRILEREGSTYTDHPSDRGGPTKFGITLATLQRVYGSTATAEDVRALTEPVARMIYAEKYVIAPGFDNVVLLSDRIAFEVIDSGVNCGPERATRWLQIALNCALDPEPDLAVDGVCGQLTLDALATYLVSRDNAESLLLAMLSSLQGAFYLRRATYTPSQRRWINGWFAQRVLPAFEDAA